MSRHSRRLLFVPATCALAALVVTAAPLASSRPPASVVGPGSGLAQAAPRPIQVVVQGSVVDAALRPVANVTVTLEAGTTVVSRTTTAADGTFRFAAVAPGRYRVRALRAGFTTLTRDLQVPSDTATLSLPLVLTTPADEKAMADMAANAARTEAAPSARGALPGVPYSAPMGSPVAAPVPAPLNRPPAGAGVAAGRGGMMAGQTTMAREAQSWPDARPAPSGDRYTRVAPHRFEFTRTNPLSTFGADVDTASYTNVRRMIASGQLPPSAAVRAEEFLNYFRFPYAPPTDGRAVALTTEISDCPWAPGHKLVLIGARADASADREIAGRNMVLLVDVSGSMAPADRLPMLQSALGMFVDTLRPDDQISIVTYAGSSGVALPPTQARQRDVIQRAIARLGAGGSTNGAQGLQMAYRLARQSFVPGGVNRVILATDGDFNVGVTSNDELLSLVERQKDSGIFLSVLGVGSGQPERLDDGADCRPRQRPLLVSRLDPGGAARARARGRFHARDRRA